MRLGGYGNFLIAKNVSELIEVSKIMDCYKLSAILAPPDILNFTDDECIEYGTRAKDLGMVIGEFGFWENLMTDDKELQSQRIKKIKAILKKADLMNCKGVLSLVGTKDKSDHAGAPHPYMYTKKCKEEFKNVILRILDGVSLNNTKYIVEPFGNTFFYEPEEIREFIEDLDHPFFGFHLDLANMINLNNYYSSEKLIESTFILLKKYIVCAHLKDIKWDVGFPMTILKLDEVPIGDGIIDYKNYLINLSLLHADTPCFCEHLNTEQEHSLYFSRLHYIAGKAGVKFVERDNSRF